MDRSTTLKDLFSLNKHKLLILCLIHLLDNGLVGFKDNSHIAK